MFKYIKNFSNVVTGKCKIKYVFCIIFQLDSIEVEWGLANNDPWAKSSLFL